MPSIDFKAFNIFCFCMKDEEEYQRGEIHPIYVFLHEVGHIICWLITQKDRKVPKSFFDSIGKYTNGLESSNPDALEVFADSFAMSVMHNTSLDVYNPFKMLREELYVALEEYYSQIVAEIAQNFSQKVAIQ